MSGRSGIGVLVAGFSRVGALKKHAPLVFSTNYMYLEVSFSRSGGSNHHPALGRCVTKKAWLNEG